MSFWNKLKKPILVLAPLADVTDASFRRVIAKYGKPSVMWTEFVSADGLILAPEKGKKKLMKDLIFTEEERPIVAQFFTARPEMMKKVAMLARELGFDGIDINIGCPDRSIEKQGAGAALIKNPTLAREIIKSAKDGAGDLPVSVKTRIGYNKDELENWIRELLAEEPAVITIHARTRKEMSKVPARWDRIKRAVEIRDEMKSKTLIFGNGDVKDIDDALMKAKETGADGVMLGRAIFGTPHLFDRVGNWNINDKEVRRKKLLILKEHASLFEKLLGDVKSFAVMKKHFKSYVDGFPDVKDLRLKLMETNNYNEVATVIDEYLAG